MKLLSHARLLMTPWTAAYQAPPSMGFSRQEYWSGVPSPSPNELTVVKNFPTTHTLIVAGAGLGHPSCLLIKLYYIIEGYHVNKDNYCIVGILLFDYSPSLNHFKLIKCIDLGLLESLKFCDSGHLNSLYLELLAIPYSHQETC